MLSYIGGDTSGWSLHTLDVPTDTERKLVDVQPFFGQPAPWSPDGSELAVMNARNRLAIVHADGSDLRELTSDRRPSARPPGLATGAASR